MKVSKEIARELLELWKPGQNTCDWVDDNGTEHPLCFEFVQSELVDTSRWSNIHEVIYKDMATE